MAKFLYEKNRTYPIIGWSEIPAAIRDKGDIRTIRAVWLGEERPPRAGEFFMVHNLLGARYTSVALDIVRPIAHAARVEFIEAVVEILGGEPALPSEPELYFIAIAHAGLTGLPDFQSLRAVRTGEIRPPQRGEWYLANIRPGEPLQAWQAIVGVSGHCYPIARLVRVLAEAGPTA